jgi:DNA-binding IscR family transcriptional regulator
VADVLLATERDIQLVDCVSKRKKRGECAIDGACVTQELWNEAGKRLVDYFSGITIKDLCERGQSLGIKREQDHRFMYFI